MKPESFLPMRVSIEFEYNAPVFDGDPDDKYELAELERTAYVDDFKDVLEGIVGDIEGLEVVIKPKP